MPATAPDKLIVSNGERLLEKYGRAGAAAVARGVSRLIKADAGRGIVSQYVDLSDAATIASLGVVPVSASLAGDPQVNKDAIDAVFTHATVRPSYLLLLGSVDVIPHVPLRNPAEGDGDPNVPSDLPYACDHPYGLDVQDFLSPTRVVGRLPNVTNDRDAAYLVDLLATAETYQNRPASDFGAFLGISADVWKASTALSLDVAFGNHDGMKIAPPDGYKWTAGEIRRLSHFVNCHGAPGDPFFYGQKGASFPPAHSAAWLASRLGEATVMAAECCYGAELYDPSVATAAGQMGMANTYLGRKAYAYLGSTTIAYGPVATNNEADLICQVFFEALLAGASTGRACLQARLDYVRKKGAVLTPTDLKTLGQFTLLGDPSLTPVASPHAPRVVATSPRARARGLEAAAAEVARYDRESRRLSLASQAATIRPFRLTLPTRVRSPAKMGAFAQLRKAAAEHGVTDPDVFLSYDVNPTVPTPGFKGLESFAPRIGAGPRAVHTLMEHREPPASAPNLRLIRGINGIEFDTGMKIQAFESR